MSNRPTMLVAAGVIVEGGRVLITQRKKGAHLAGLWELPGGKVEPGEDPREALGRELREELGIETSVGDILDVTFHRYDDADKTVLLLFFLATRLPGSPPPRALDVAAFEWSDTAGLDPARFPPADVPVLAKIRGLLCSTPAPA
jgi:8-oxo-dGTP diphosphatase